MSRVKLLTFKTTVQRHGHLEHYVDSWRMLCFKDMPPNTRNISNEEIFLNKPIKRWLAGSYAG